MKLKNILKNQNFWLSVFLVLIIGFGYYLYFQDKTEFIIYKQECEDLGKTCDKYCVDFCARVKLNDTENAEHIFNKNTYDRFWKCLNYNNCCENSCEVIEVDEIVYKSKYSYSTRCLENPKDKRDELKNDTFWEIWFNENCELNYPIQMISKEDLTKDWLENNCDVCHDFICISKSENTNISAIEFANEDLKFYQCGDYTVNIK